jgi:tellurite resistance protein
MAPKAARRQAADAVVRAEREKARQILEIQAEIAKGKEDAALAGVDAEEASAEFEVEMGRRSQAQLIQQERQFENERYAIRRQACCRACARRARSEHQPAKAPPDL